MGLLDDIQRGVGAAAAASERALKISKLKSEVGSLSGNRGQAIMNLGQTAFGLIKDSKLDSPELAELSRSIDAIDARIAELQGEIQALQMQGDVSGAPCRSCGRPMPAGVRFCPVCGTPAPEPEAAPQAPAGPPCGSCGAPLSPGVRFCTACGTPVETPDA